MKFSCSTATASRRACVGVALLVGASGLFGCGETPLVVEDGPASSPDLIVVSPPDLMMPALRNDFPPDPIIDNSGGSSGVPANAQALFATAGSPVGGPCFVEPQSRALYPSNWPAPTFTFSPVGAENLFELRFIAEGEKYPLIVYTSSSSWTMPSTVWSGIVQHLVDVDVTVSVRGATFTGGTLVDGPNGGGASVFRISAASASGTLVFMASGATGQVEVRGAGVSDPWSRSLVRPTSSGMQCVGCHSISPDGTFAAFAQTPVGAQYSSSLGLALLDGAAQTPAWLGGSARSLLAQTIQSLPSMSTGHMQTGDWIVLSTLTDNEGHASINWIDLTTTTTGTDSAHGVLARNGDLWEATYPRFNHRGDTVYYVHASTVENGSQVRDGDIISVPWNNRQGGGAAAVQGAHTPDWSEYAPSVSSDDRYLAFARVKAGELNYGNPGATVHVIPAGGGQSTPIDANTPPSCGNSSTILQVGNTAPAWSPDPPFVLTQGRALYWLAFSSRRGDGQTPQIYVSAVIVDENQNPTSITTTPPLRLVGQPSMTPNFAPDWHITHP